MPKQPKPHKLDAQHWLLDVSDPNEKTEDGQPVSRAIVLKGKRAGRAGRGGFSQLLTKSLTSQVKIKPDEAKELYRNDQVVEPFIPINVLNTFAQTCSIHSIALQRKARVIAGLGIKAIASENERSLRQIVRKARRKQMGDPALANWDAGVDIDEDEEAGTGTDPKGKRRASFDDRAAPARPGANGSGKPAEQDLFAPRKKPDSKFAFDPRKQGDDDEAKDDPFAHGNGNGNGNGKPKSVLSQFGGGDDALAAGDQWQEDQDQQAERQAKIDKAIEAKVKEAKAQLAKMEKEKKVLEEWLDTAGDDMPLREVLERAWYDFESIGWMGIEVVPNAAGKPATLVHIPAHLIRRTKDRERFVFLKSPTKKVWFKSFGNEKHLDVDSGVFTDAPLPERKEANEIIFWYQYSALDPFYGVPGWYAALPEILGSNEARDFMLFYFTRRATPTYAIILEGGTFGTQQLSHIRNFFRRDLTGDYHATLLLEAPKDGKLTFQRMTDEPRWVLLVQQYLDSLRDAIVSAHGMFPALLGIIETAHLGSGTSDSQFQIFKSVEAKPKQETLEGLLNNQIVRKALKITTQKLKLDELDIFDEAVEVSAVNTLYAAPPRPSITLNEARKRLRYEPIEEEWADEILMQGANGLVPLSHLELPQQAQQAMGAQNPMGAPTDPFGGGGGDLSGLFGDPAGGDGFGGGENGNGKPVGVGGYSPNQG